MLDLTIAQQDALLNRHVMRRDFVYCEARDPVTGDPAPAGFWNGSVNVSQGGRDYIGAGTLISVAPLTANSNLSIPGLIVMLSGISSAVASLVRGSTVGQAPMRYDIGIFDPETRQLIGPLVRRFAGFVDDIEIKTPPKGGKSTITLTCESTSRALTFKSTDTRSQESQQRRLSTDDFFKYTAGARADPIYFGRPAPHHRANK